MDRKGGETGALVLRVLSLSTLHPSAAAPNFGRFVQLSLDAADATGEAEIVRICPNGLPPWPLAQLHPRYRAFAALPEMDGTIHRPRFTLFPGLKPARNAAAIAKSVIPLAHRLHQAKPFDLIDSQFFWPDGPAAMLVAEALGLPFSVKARGSDIHQWTKIPGCREQIIEAAQKAKGLLAVSEALKTDIIELGINGSKIIVHHTGIDRSLFHVANASRRDLRHRIDLPLGGPLLLSVGTLNERKGHALAIEACAKLPGTQLAIIGTGQDLGALKRRAAELGIDDCVHFLGGLPHRDIARHVQAANVFVLPSASEGIANVWIEALACGTPIVIADAGGAREVLTAPIGGQIVERNSTAIANAITEILANPPERDKVAGLVAKFSWERNGEALVAYWRSLIAS
jgi:teichuronic acid biosynthesis glycosyltransferase TuaC